MKTLFSRTAIVSLLGLGLAGALAVGCGSWFGGAKPETHGTARAVPAEPLPTWEEEQQILQADELPLATFGGGRFWSMEAVFQELKGIKAVAPGYAGGDVASATYDLVKAGKTRHAEVIQISYDPAIITYEELLEVFWKSHDPTSANRQGSDVGPQYRSVIFYHSESQRLAAEAAKRQLAESPKTEAKPVVTDICAFTTFTPAETDHQNFFTQNPADSYSQEVIQPRVEQLRAEFAEKVRPPMKVTKSDDEWRELLSPQQYKVARQCGTEPAFNNEYWNNKRAGSYHCVCCGALLFDSDTKYDSGSGWPSFFKPVANEAVSEHDDWSLFGRRTEIRCHACEAHLGHVFADGPAPTGLRYCINSAAMKFVPREEQPETKEAEKTEE